MKTTTRYSLIIFGIIVFLILAPMLVLYISGRKVNLTDRDTTATGILDAKSNPGGATLLINDKDQGTTPAISRFLVQGQYKITIHKDGFYDWVKNLVVEPGKVTYTQEGVDEVQLIKKSLPITIADRDVKSFVMIDNAIWYITSKNIVRTSFKDLQSIQNIPIPTTLEKPNLTVLRDKKHIYLGEGYILNTDDNSIIQVPIDFSEISQPDNISVSPNNIVIFADGTGLRAYDPTTKKVTVLISHNVNAFTMIGTTGYFVETTNNSTGESNIITAIWNGKTFTDYQTLISKEYLSPTTNYLYITDNKALFCVSAGKLYKVNQKLDLVNGDIKSAHLDLTTNEFEYRTSSELWFYNFLANQPQLLTRSANSTNDLIIRSAIGYGFTATSDGLEAIEIDNRDKQNRYPVLPNSKPVWKVAMTPDQKTIIALQDGSLVSIEIRN